MIYTFYSYKGGVGRSMALVNIAELMYQAGLKVLMIDWDLEAPGLECFFPSTVETVLNHEGLMDMLLYYKQKRLAFDPDKQASIVPIYDNIEQQYLVDLRPKPTYFDDDPRLWLLPAGRRKDKFAEYSKQVSAFDWRDFYNNWDGERYFEILRKDLEKLADVILIDSRTGVTDMGGVCTYQLADVVVGLTIPSNQSMNGIFQIIQNLNASEFQALRQRVNKPLKTLIIPARIEKFGEQTILNLFRSQFETTFTLYLPKEFEGKYDLLEIPHVPYYSFTEKVATNLQTRKSKERSPELERVYLTLLKIMEKMTPEVNIKIKERLTGFLSSNYENLVLSLSDTENIISTADQISQLYEQLNVAKENLSHAQQTLTQTKSDVDKKRVNIETLQVQKQNAEHLMDQAKEDYLGRLSRINAFLTKNYQEFFETQFAWNNQLTDIERKIKETQASLQELEQLKQLLDITRTELETTTQENRRLDEFSRTQEEALKVLNKRLDEFNDKYSQATQELVQLQEDLQLQGQALENATQRLSIFDSNFFTYIVISWFFAVLSGGAIVNYFSLFSPIVIAVISGFALPFFGLFAGYISVTLYYTTKRD